MHAIQAHYLSNWMSATLTHSDLLDLAHVKFGLLAQGAVVESGADAAVHDAKRPIRTRSGVSGGLDIRLAGGIDVNVPVVDPFAQESPYALSYADGQFRVMCETEVLSSYEPVPTPAYYDTKTADDTEWMHRIGQMCSADRFCYGMTGPTCYFWARSRRCQYCTIGETTPPTQSVSSRIICSKSCEQQSKTKRFPHGMC